MPRGAVFVGLDQVAGGFLSHYRKQMRPASQSGTGRTVGFPADLTSPFDSLYQAA
jgi:hypothetical protein